MATTADLIQQTRSYLMSSRRDQQNLLASDYDAQAVLAGLSTMNMLYAVDGISYGAQIAVDLEVLTVFAVDVATKSVTVKGGQLGSTAADHAAASFVTVNPEFSDFAILREINNTAKDLSASGLYRVRTVATTYNAAVQGYDLAADADGLLEVTYDAPGPAELWPRIPLSKTAIKRNMDTSIFPSGVAVVLYEGAQPGRALRFSYKAAYGVTTAITDNVETTLGIHSSATDLLSLGAALRLTGTQEVKRNLLGSQSDTRRVSEVPPGANVGAARWLASEYSRRKIAETARLAREYPVRTRRR